MGCDFFWEGYIVQPEIQEHAVKFIRSFFEENYESKPVIIHPKENSQFTTLIQERPVTIHTEENSHFTTWIQEGHDKEKIIKNYPFNFYGIALFGGGDLFSERMQFIFDRSDNGRLVSIVNTPEFQAKGYTDREEDMDAEVIITHTCRYSLSGIEVEFALMLNILKIRYCSDLTVNDHYDCFEGIADCIKCWGLVAFFENENLDFSKCNEMFCQEYSKRFPKSTIPSVPSDKAGMLLDDLELSVRTSNCLKNAEVKTVGELIRKTTEELLQVNNFGRKSLLEITEIIKDMGLELRQNWNMTRLIQNPINWALRNPWNSNALLPLIMALEDKSENMRREAVRALGNVHDIRAAMPLIKVLWDESESVRDTAAWALGEIGDVGTVMPLTKALLDKSETVRATAAWALGRIGSPQAVVALIKALDDAPENVRRAAAVALGFIGDTRAILPLVNLLHNEDIRGKAATALAIMGSDTIEPVIKELGNHNEDIRATAAWILGKIGGDRARHFLIKALGDASKYVRDTATKALEKIYDTSSGANIFKRRMMISQVVEKDLKQQLFGSARKIPCKGRHTIDLTELVKPLEWERAVMHSFCEGCGFTLEIGAEIAFEMAEKAGVDLPSSPERHYFHTKCCELCDGNDATIELRFIPK